MGKDSLDLLHGTLDVLILKALPHGISAMLSLLVAARTPDFAVGLALGAPPSR